MKAALTATCQGDFSGAALVAALESGWAAIRARHLELPAVVIVVGSGSPARASAGLRLGHFASSRWQHGDQLLPEVFVSGEGLQFGAAEILGTLLHEAAHGLASVREIADTSRQGRWHNKRFAEVAAEVGLAVAKDVKLGWSNTTLEPATVKAYRVVLAELSGAVSAYRHADETPEAAQRNSSNGGVLECACPRKIRVSASTAAKGPILCGVCETPFRADEEAGEP